MVSAVITAAGTGKRMKSGISKQYMEICGKPVLAYTLERFETCNTVDEIIIVTGKNDIEFVKKEIVEKYGFKKVKKIVAGGKERQDSVRNGIHKNQACKPFRSCFDNEFVQCFKLSDSFIILSVQGIELSVDDR